MDAAKENGMKPTYYITTPLYYPSGKWHLGHSYTTVCCDALARFKRMSGYDVFYLTGTDEHGQKIAERAAAAGKTPKEFVDGLVGEIKDLWKLLDITYDKFIRTTDDYHVASVQKIFKKLYDQGDIYKATYKGKYCTPCEAFWTEAQLVDGKCPDCGREVKDAEEESYFFRLSKYADRIEKLLTETDFLQPSSRVNEMVNNFIKPGLNDLAVSRTSVKWGIPVSFDDKHTVYVWIDALSNYINALGYNADEKNMKYWPADLHMVGKEIVRFHAIVWPAILMALDLPLPKHVYGHGWLLLSGDKMSKSKGNVADPFVLTERYGIDSVRYYLLREIPFGSDGAYSDKSFIGRHNSDLANDLGNLAKRTLAMARQYFGGVVGDDGEAAAEDEELVSATANLPTAVGAAMDGLSCSKALEEIFAVVSRANKYIDVTMPWVLNKEGKTDRLRRVIYNLLEALRVCSIYLLPFITRGPRRILELLGVPEPQEFSAAAPQKEYRTQEGEAIYKRLDLNKELEAMNEASKEEKKEVKEVKQAQPAPAADGLIGIDEFFKSKLVVAEVVSAEKIEKTDKLLKLVVKAGDEQRVVVSGIAKSYAPEELVGKQVIMVANLKPVKLKGVESFGMLLCATDGDKVVLISPERKVESGAEVG